MANVRADLPFLLIGGFLDEKQHFETIEAMKNCPDHYLGKTYFCINDEDGCFYIYSSTNEINADTGKWRKFEGGGFISFEDWKPDTEYKANDYVVYGNCLWICITNHTSGSDFVEGELVDDITTTYWVLVIGTPIQYLEDIFLTEEEMNTLISGIFHKIETNILDASGYTLTDKDGYTILAKEN